MNQIPLSWLNSFLVFNDSKNIMEAAAKLRITQPALSKHLKQLEAALGEPIFAIKGRKKVLTPMGRSLHGSLEKRIGNIQEVIAQTRALHGDSKTAVIRIAARRGVLDRISPKLKFDGKIFLQEASNDEILDSLLNFGAEIGIAHKIPDAHGLVAKPLFQEVFHLVVPKKLCSARPVLGAAFLSRLKELPCLGYSPNDPILGAVYGNYTVTATGLRIVRATENYQAIAEMVEAGIGWAILPSYLAVSEAKNWLVALPAKALPPRNFFLLYRGEYRSVLWFKALIAEIQACFLTK